MRVFIVLGAIREPAFAFRAAVAEPRAIGQVVRVSSLYDSAPRKRLKAMAEGIHDGGATTRS